MTDTSRAFQNGELIDPDFKVPLLLDGEFVQSTTQQFIDVTNPATQAVICQAPVTTDAEMEVAIASAKAAFDEWREVPPPERARLMFVYQGLLKKHQADIATVLAKETGKIFDDAMGDVWRGIEVAEHACGISTLIMGETVENVARGIDTYSYVQPLGVCAGITPFNFPAMIPLWMFPMAIACGNAFILKPSEQDPMTPTMLAELFVEAGFPKGLLQVVHGGKDQVDTLLTHKDIKTISFVGSVPVGQYIYRTATDNLKRVQAFAGAKNHVVIMPDADRQRVVDNLVGSSCGAAGQRCMALSVAVFVGSAQEWIPDIKEALSKIQPGPSHSKTAAYGPVINPKAKERALKLIASAYEQGADVLLDGSDCTVEGYPNGNWIGPTLFDNVTVDMDVYKEEIFGPALAIVRSDSLEDAISLINNNQYGNGTAIFTASGAAARKYQHEIEVGQVGINVPIPVPLPFFSFTGWKNSFYGDLHAYGKQAVRFYTETKTITSRWFDESIPSEGANMTIKLK